MKHKTKHILPKKLFFLALAIGFLLALRWFITDGRIPGFELGLRWIFFLVAMSIGGLGAFVTYFEYHGIGSQEGIVRRGNRTPHVAITFDDGPHPKHTPKILDILKEKKVKATFFAVGKKVEKYPEIAQRIVNEGHDIGNHTYSHKEMAPSTRKTIMKELSKTKEAIYKTTGVISSLFRPPRGIYSQASRGLIVDELGYKMILWSVSSVDWRRTSPNWILNRIRRYARFGSIILFHDGGSSVKREGESRINTVNALPMVIDYLHSQDLRIVPVSQMLDGMSADEDEFSFFDEPEPQPVSQKN